MLEQYSQLSENKNVFLNRARDKIMKKQSAKREEYFQDKAMVFIEHECKVINVLKIANLLSAATTKSMGETFELIKSSGRETKKECLPVLLKEKMVCKKIKCALENKFKREKKHCFYELLKFYNPKNKSEKFIENLPNTSFQNMKNENISKMQEQKLNLSELEISVICPKLNKELASTYELEPESEFKIINKDINEGLKIEINNKRKQIEDFETEQEKIVNKMKNTLAKYQQIEECINTNREIKSSKFEDSSLEGETLKVSPEDEIVAKLIKTNYELEEKLEYVHELLSSISPNIKTEFGLKLSSIIRKKNRNKQLEFCEEI